MTSTIAAHIREVLAGLGEDPNREGLLKTPARVESALRDMTTGYSQDPVAILNEAMFAVESDEMVIVKDIELYSMCEHHMLPFFGKAHVAYLPAGRIVGLSKLPRIVDMFARRLQVQERLTNQIADALDTHLQPLGVAVVIECRHMCMESRGVRHTGTATVSSALRGSIKTNPDTRREFLSLIGR